MVFFTQFFIQSLGRIMKEIVIAAFYKFIPLDDFESMRKPMLAKMHELHIRGTVILAQEGINGGFAGSRESMDNFYAYIQSDARLADIKFKETLDALNPFDKAKVKLRKEIVSMGVKGVDPIVSPGAYLDPVQWNAMIQDPNVILLDTRNEYEYELGTFKNAINPKIDNFREFPEYVKEHLSDKKDKKIAMFCTGGIRCEKTTAYMREQGFEHVYQLHDGILHYMETMSEDESLWEGECFVFDDRVAVDKKLERVYPQLPQDYKERYGEKNK